MTWLVDKRVLHIVLEGELTAELIHNMVLQSREMTRMGIRPVHAVADATHAESIPKHINTIVREYQEVKPEDNGFTVLIATSPLTRFFTQLLFRALRLEVRFAATVDDALAILGRIDPTLPHSPKIAN
jgi:hypothetical protein